jgi:hypothetical protein
VLRVSSLLGVRNRAGAFAEHLGRTREGRHASRRHTVESLGSNHRMVC